MRTLLVLGAGRSSGALIEYLLGQASAQDWQVIVADKVLESAQSAIHHHERGAAICFDPDDAEGSRTILASADVVISLLPPSLHFDVAKRCLILRKHFLTASYVTEEMRSLHEDAKSAGLLFLNECGLDPGIDHMSAMEMIDRIQAEGGRIQSFESFAGGLIAPETDPENPWRYKFTWNPRNVVTAGQQGDAEYLVNGLRKRVAYEELFQCTTRISINDFGEFEGYPNRDSLRYIKLYDLRDVRTMIRGTLRFKGFCSAWNVLVRLGCCYDRGMINNADTMTHSDFINTFLKTGKGTPEERLSAQLDIPIDGHEMKCLRWSGFFDAEFVGIKAGTPAAILEHILMKKWRLKPGDRDLVVMWHRFSYEFRKEMKVVQYCLALKGTDQSHTAMALTVGLPLGIATRLLLENKIQQRGVVIPLKREFYGPILHELSLRGISFRMTDA